MSSKRIQLRKRASAHALALCLCLHSVPGGAAPIDGQPALDALRAQIQVLSTAAGASMVRATEDTKMVGELVTATKARMLNQGADDTLPAWRTVQANLEARFKKMDEAERNRLVAISKTSPNGAQLMADEARRIVDVVVFQTIANDRTLEAARDPNGDFVWRRLSFGQGPRDAQSLKMNEWHEIDKAYSQYKARMDAFKRDHFADIADHGSEFYNAKLREVKQENPGLHPEQFFADKLKKKLAEEDRDTQVNRLRTRLSRIFLAQGDKVDPDLVSDLAEIHYLMTGWTVKDGTERRAAEIALKPLAVEIANSAGTPLSKILKDKENTHGFQRMEPQPTGFLSRYDYLRTVQAGYLLDDPGAGIHHGALTHRIQWRAIMEDYEANPKRYNFPPVEVFTLMGAHDTALRDEVALQNADNEIPLDLEVYTMEVWSQMFDLSNRNTSGVVDDFSHPEAVSPVIASAGDLDAIRDSLNDLYTDRRRIGKDLADEWKKQVNGQIGTFSPTGTLAFLIPGQDRYNAIIAENRALRALPIPRTQIQLDSYFDKYYQQNLYATQEASGLYQNAIVIGLDGTNRTLDMLVPVGEMLAVTADTTAVKAARIAHQQRVTPEPPGGTQDVTDADVDEAHDVADASIADNSALRRERAQSETDAAIVDAEDGPPLPDGIDVTEFDEQSVDEDHDAALTVAEAAKQDDAEEDKRNAGDSERGDTGNDQDIETGRTGERGQI